MSGSLSSRTALQPAITGKNPSFWRADGEPQLISHARPVSPEVLLERIAIAERPGKEIGLAVIPGGDLTSIDFDTKHYGSVQELEEDWVNLVDRYPVLTGSRMERTPPVVCTSMCGSRIGWPVGSDPEVGCTATSRQSRAVRIVVRFWQACGSRSAPRPAMARAPMS